MTLQPPLASVALKRKPATMGKRAPREPSIVGWFSQLPELRSVADSVALAVCYLALVAAAAPLEVIREDAQNGSTRATIPDGPAAVEPVGK
jgi:hypothetical protein